MAGRLSGRIIAGAIISIFALMPIAGPGQLVSAEKPTALVTVSISEFDEEQETLVPVAGSCVLVSIWLGLVDRYCDGTADDLDSRAGFIAFRLPAGMVYSYDLDIEANLPKNAYTVMAPYEPLAETGADVYFEGVSCQPRCPPLLSYFVSLPTGDEPNDELRDGVPVQGACFILRRADGSTLPEQCSSSYGIDFPEVGLDTYTIEPTRLPKGCTVDEIAAPQPFEVTQEVIDYALSGNSWGNFYAGDIYLTCEPEHLAILTVAVVQCPVNTLQDGLSCDGIPLAGAEFTFSEELLVPPLVSGTDGIDSVAVMPGYMDVARLRSDADPDRLQVDYVAEVTCIETGSEQVLVNERIYRTENSLFSSVPFRLTLAAGDDVMCSVTEFTGPAEPIPNPTDEPAA